MNEVNIDSLLKAVEKLANQLEINNDNGKFPIAFFRFYAETLLHLLDKIDSIIQQCKIDRWLCCN